MFRDRLSLSMLATGLLILVLSATCSFGQIGQPAKDFTLKDINPKSRTYQEQISLSNYHGAILVLFFYSARENQAAQRAILASLLEPETGLWPVYKHACVRVFAISGFCRESEAEALAMLPNTSSADLPLLMDSDELAWGGYDEFYGQISQCRVPLAVVIGHEFKIMFCKDGVSEYEYYNDNLKGAVDGLGPDDDESPHLDNCTLDEDLGATRCMPIEFDILDGCGVDIETLEVTISSGDELNPTWTRVDDGYHVTAPPPSGCWAVDAHLTYTVSCSDYSGNWGSSDYRFTTAPEDMSPPQWTNKQPREDQPNVMPDAVISFDVYDDETCVDLESLRVFIREETDSTRREVTDSIQTSELESYEGFHVVYDSPTDFNINEWVEVHVEAAQVCADLVLSDFYRFWVGTGELMFTDHQPPDGSTSVSPGRNTISVNVTDPKYGVDYASLRMWLNDEVKGFSRTPIEDGYHLAFEANLAGGTRYRAKVHAENEDHKAYEDTWAFTTEDRTPPLITARRPLDGAYNVPNDTDIWFRISDLGDGVARQTIRMWVNEVEVTSRLVKEQYELGSDAVFDCTFSPEKRFIDGQLVTASVEASDKKGNPMDRDTWQFTCSPVAAIRMAGWGETEIHASRAGKFEAWALVEFSEGMGKIRNVQMYGTHPATQRRYPLGISLCNVGCFEGYGLFYYGEFIPPGNEVGMMPVFDIAVEDVYGRFSSLWPYLTITDTTLGGTRSPESGRFCSTDVPWRLQALMDRNGSRRPEHSDGVLFDSLFGDVPLEKRGSSDENSAPVIFAAGFYPPVVDISETCTTTLTALVFDPDGLEDVLWVELYLEGLPGGVFLLDDGTQRNDEPNDGFFIRNFTFEAYSYDQGLHFIQLVAFDQAGNISNVYPYVTVEP